MERASTGVREVAPRCSRFQEYMKHPVVVQGRSPQIILSSPEHFLEPVEWLRSVVDVNLSYWRDLFAEYDKYVPTTAKVIAPDFGRLHASPGVRELFVYALCLKHFQPCWDKDKNTRRRFLEQKLVNDLESTLFEMFTAIQFCFLGYSTGLIPEFCEETTPDIAVRHPETYVLVECMNKRANRQRKDVVEKLIWDLTEGGIYEKVRDQVRDWGLPLILVIKIPEEINWGDESLRSVLEQQIVKRVYTDLVSHYCLVNFVIFISGLDPSVDISSGGELQTAKLTFGFPNRKAKYQIPADFRVGRTLSEAQRRKWDVGG